MKNTRKFGRLLQRNTRAKLQDSPSFDHGSSARPGPGPDQLCYSGSSCQQVSGHVIYRLRGSGYCVALEISSPRREHRGRWNMNLRRLAAATGCREPGHVCLSPRDWQLRRVWCQWQTVIAVTVTATSPCPGPGGTEPRASQSGRAREAALPETNGQARRDWRS